MRRENVGFNSEKLHSRNSIANFCVWLLSLNTALAPTSPLQPYSTSPLTDFCIILVLASSSHPDEEQSHKDCIETIPFWVEVKLANLFLKTAWVTQQTGRKTCAEIDLSQNFVQAENKPEVLPGERQGESECLFPEDLRSRERTHLIFGAHFGAERGHKTMGHSISDCIKQ